jgi:hypothetical protein
MGCSMVAQSGVERKQENSTPKNRKVTDRNVKDRTRLGGQAL